MTKKPEAALWHKLRSETTKRIDWDRIENSVSSGFPDLIGSAVYVNGHNIVCFDFYLELKVSQEKTLKSSLWRPTQVAWQTKAARRGKTIYNLVHRPLSSPIYHLYDGVDLLNLVTAEDPESVVPVAKSNDLNDLIDAIISRHRQKARNEKT